MTDKKHTEPSKVGEKTELHTAHSGVEHVSNQSGHVKSHSGKTGAPILKSEDSKASLIFVGIVVGIILLVFGILYIVAHFTDATVSFDDEYEYNGFLFVLEEIFWKTVVQKGEQQYVITFYNGPREVADIAIDVNASQAITQKDRIYLLLDEASFTDYGFSSYGIIASVEIGKIIGTRNDILNKEVFIDIIADSRFDSNEDTNSSLVEDFTESDLDLDDTQQNSTTMFDPALGCALVTETAGVIIVQAAQETSVRNIDGCVFVSGHTGEYLLKSANRLGFQLLNIMP